MEVGLALGSGGARGLVHIGVLKSLEKHGVVVSHIAGSSIGALVGAMYAAGRSVAEIEEFFLEDRSSVFKVLFDPGWFAGFVKGKKLRKLVGSWVGVSGFEELDIPFAAVACDLSSGEQRVFAKGDNLVSGICASMAVPAMFKPVLYEGKKYVDGAFVNPVPDDVAKGMGAERVVAVNLDCRKNSDDSQGNFRFAVKISSRAFNILRHHFAEQSTVDADLVLTPEIDDPGAIALRTYLDHQKCVDLIDVGERVMDGEIAKLV